MRHAHAIRCVYDRAARGRELGRNVTRVLTSLLRVEERLLEADHFARSIAVRSESHVVAYELNAFVSAARSVTFLLQKEMARVPGFSTWWASRRSLLSADPAARFFLQLRNYSQKEGRISLVGAFIGSESGGYWSFRFAGNEARVPDSLLNRDVSECCKEHVAKLANIFLACTDQFPYHSCPRRALSVDGLLAVGSSIEEVEAAVGLPRGWTECAPGDVGGRLGVLARMCQGSPNFPQLGSSNFPHPRVAVTRRIQFPQRASVRP